MHKMAARAATITETTAIMTLDEERLGKSIREDIPQMSPCHDRCHWQHSQSLGGKEGFHLCIVSTFTSEGVVESDVTEVPEARFSSRRQPGSFQWGLAESLMSKFVSLAMLGPCDSTRDRERE